MTATRCKECDGMDPETRLLSLKKKQLEQFTSDGPTLVQEADERTPHFPLAAHVY